MKRTVTSLRLKCLRHSPDSRNAVIAVEYDAPVVTDPDAKGKYHWYTNRRTRHTEIRQSENAGRHALPKAVTGDQYENLIEIIVADALLLRRRGAARIPTRAASIESLLKQDDQGRDAVAQFPPVRLPPPQAEAGLQYGLSKMPEMKREGGRPVHPAAG